MEAYAWLPKLSNWLLERFLCQVHPEDQERCWEEWNAQLDALPNSVAKIVHALSYCGAAKRINADVFQAKCDEIDEQLKDAADQHRVNMEQLHACVLKRPPRDYLENAVQDALSKVQASANGHPNALQVQSALSAIEKFAHTLVRANNRARDLLDVQLDGLISRFDHVGRLIQMASRKRNDANELLRKGDLSSGTLENVLSCISVDLNKIRNLSEGEVFWADDDSRKEHERIMSAISQAVDNQGRRFQ
jgi:hypothetical protein